jgi:hypothetical protein
MVEPAVMVALARQHSHCARQVLLQRKCAPAAVRGLHPCCPVRHALACSAAAAALTGWHRCCCHQSHGQSHLNVAALQPAAQTQ